MSDASRHAANLRDRLTSGTEDKIGKALADLLDNPLVTGTIGRAFDARERATQAQELALAALNIPTAADIERLTRRLRSVSQRLEGIEDGVHRLDRALSDRSIDTRLSVIEGQLKALSGKLGGETPGHAASKQAESKQAESKQAESKHGESRQAAPKRPASKQASSKRQTPTRAARSAKTSALKAAGASRAKKA